jgi:hypothetical protein
MARHHAGTLAAATSAYSSVVSADELVIAVSAPDYYTCSLLRALRKHVERGPAPPVFCLSASRGPVEVWRIDANAVALRAPGGWLDQPFNRLFRSTRTPLRAGERVYVGALEATVDEASPGGDARAVTYRLSWPLASEKLRFVAWDGTRFVPTTPPAAGERRVLSTPRR